MCGVGSGWAAVVALCLPVGLTLAGCSEPAEEPESRPTTAEATPSPSETPTSGSPSPTAPSPTAGATTSAPSRPGPPRVVGTIARDLDVPWGIAFLPNGDALVTERDTRRVVRIDAETRAVRSLGDVEAAVPSAEGGLLGIAVSPDFASDRTIFLYLSTEEDNRVVRTTLQGGRLGPMEDILTGIPVAGNHDGGRLAFGPDGYLYVSTGEAGQPELAQDRGNLGGKILRITPEGEPAPGNPFGDEIWSWGHRNVQGLAFVDDQLWASEFGQNTWDELNRIERGANYGWPRVEGRGGRGEGFVDPVEVWDTDDASPSGLAYADGALWMGALRGERLWRIPVEGRSTGEPRAFFVGDYGRMRTVVTAPDGSLWVTTSNHDGRGSPAPEDDRILRVQP